MKKKRLVLFSDLSNRSGIELIKGITRYFKTTGNWILHLEPSFSVKSLLEKKTAISGVDALFIKSLHSPELEEFIKTLNVPIIASLDKKVENCINIISDDNQVVEMSIDSFRESGLENYAFYGYKNQVFSNARHYHFTRKLKRMGVKPYEYLDSYYENLFFWSNEFTHLSDWLKALPKPIGIMCCCDHTAFRLVNSCKELNLDIPEQVSVLSVGDNELVCNLNSPEISSIVLDFEHAGYLGAKILDKSTKKNARQTKLISTKPKYIIKRHSTDILITGNENVTQAVQYIHKNAPQKILKVDDVVEVAGISRRYLEKKFKEIFGRTVYEEIRRVRVREICKLLLDTNLTISEISYRLGYLGDSHIRRYFKAEVGITPSQYRKQNKI